MVESFKMSSDSDSAGSSLFGDSASPGQSSGAENTTVRSIFEPYMDEPPARAVQQPEERHHDGRGQRNKDADKDA